MLSIAICDDELFFAEQLKETVCRCLSSLNRGADIRVFDSGSSLLRSNLVFDIILLDIQMPEVNGISVAMELRREKKHSQIIFISSYKKYVFQAFDADAAHYLLKPVSEEKLTALLKKLMARLDSLDCKSITFSKGSSTWILYIRDILYCESIDHKIYIQTATCQYDYFGTLDTLQEQLDSRFFRCHRSYLVNMAQVTELMPGTAIISGGFTVFISRRRQQEFTQRLLSFVRSEVL